MIHHDLNLFYNVCNTVNQHYQKLVNFLSLFLLILFWYLCKRELKSLSIVSSISLPIKVYKLPLVLCIIRVWSEYLEEIKLIVIVNWIFHSPWVLKSSIKSFKYGLISAKYSLIDRVMFLPLLHYFYI